MVPTPVPDKEAWKRTMQPARAPKSGAAIIGRERPNTKKSRNYSGAPQNAPRFWHRLSTRVSGPPKRHAARLVERDPASAARRCGHGEHPSFTPPASPLIFLKRCLGRTSSPGTPCPGPSLVTWSVRTTAAACGLRSRSLRPKLLGPSGPSLSWGPGRRDPPSLGLEAVTGFLLICGLLDSSTGPWLAARLGRLVLG
jgi:hypothetical protein